MWDVTPFLIDSELLIFQRIVAFSSSGSRGLSLLKMKVN